MRENQIERQEADTTYTSRIVQTKDQKSDDFNPEEWGDECLVVTIKK